MEQRTPKAPGPLSGGERAGATNTSTEQRELYTKLRGATQAEREAECEGYRNRCPCEA